MSSQAEGNGKSYKKGPRQQPNVKPQTDSKGILERFSWPRVGLLLLLATVVALFFPAQAPGASLLVVLVLSVLFVFASENIRKFSPKDSDLFFLTLLLMTMMFLTKASVFFFLLLGKILPEIPYVAYLYGIGIPAGAMLVRIVLNSETALVFSLVASACAGWFMENSFFFSLYFFVGSLVGAHSVGFAEDRSILIRAGLKVGFVNILTILCQNLIHHQWVLMDLGFKIF